MGGGVGATLSRVISKPGGSKESKGKEREREEAAAHVVHIEGVGPKVIMGAVKDDWVMYRCVPLSRPWLGGRGELNASVVASCRPQDYVIAEPIVRPPCLPEGTGRRGRAEHPNCRDSAPLPSSTSRNSRPSPAAARRLL